VSGPTGPTIRTADEWVAAIESGRGMAFTMPTVMRNFSTARIVVVPVDDLPPAVVLLAWRTGDDDPLTKAFVRAASRVRPSGGSSPGGVETSVEAIHNAGL
jgi:DNA-binding transcriptional LysR family regulator